MPTPTPSDLLDAITALLGRRDLTQQEVQAWASGTPDGGPNHDGWYPFTDSTGFVRLIPSPAAQIGQLQGLRSLTEWVTDTPYGSADDTQLWERAIASGEPFFVPKLQPLAGQNIRLSKVSHLEIPTQCVIYGANFESGIEVLPDGMTGMKTAYAASYIALQGLQIDGHWEVQPDSATGNAHGLHIAGGYDDKPGEGYAGSPIRAGSPVNSQDPRHRIDVKVYRAAGAGVKHEGRGASVSRYETFLCCDGVQYYTYDNQVFFDIGASARHGFMGSGYTGNNIIYGKSWYSGTGSGQTQWQQDKLIAAGIDPFQDWYNFYFIQSSRNQLFIQSQDGSGGALYGSYMRDNRIYGHFEGPADAVYNGPDKNNTDSNGRAWGKPGTAAINLDNCTDNTMDVTVERRNALAGASGALDNCFTVLRVSGTAAQGSFFSLNQRGWTEDQYFDSVTSGNDWTGGFTNPNYVRVNGTIYNTLWGTKPDGTLSFGRATNSGYAGMKIWTDKIPTGTPGDGLQGTVDVYFRKLIRVQFQTDTGTYTDVIRSEGSNVALLSNMRLVSDGGSGADGSFRLGWSSNSFLGQLPPTCFKFWSPSSTTPNTIDLIGGGATSSGAAGGIRITMYDPTISTFSQAINVTFAAGTAGAKIGFFGVTPVAKPAAVTQVTGAPGSTYGSAEQTLLNNTKNQLNEVIDRLRKLGLIST